MSKLVKCDWSECKSQAPVPGNGAAMPVGWAYVEWSAKVPGEPNASLEVLTRMYKGMGKAVKDSYAQKTIFDNAVKALEGYEPPPHTVVFRATICDKCVAENMRLDSFDTSDF